MGSNSIEHKYENEIDKYYTLSKLFICSNCICNRENKNKIKSRLKSCSRAVDVVWSRHCIPLSVSKKVFFVKMCLAYFYCWPSYGHQIRYYTKQLCIYCSNYTEHHGMERHTKGNMTRNRTKPKNEQRDYHLISSLFSINRHLYIRPQ